MTALLAVVICPESAMTALLAVVICPESAMTALLAVVICSESAMTALLAAVSCPESAMTANGGRWERGWGVRCYFPLASGCATPLTTVRNPTSEIRSTLDSQYRL